VVKATIANPVSICFAELSYTAYGEFVRLGDDPADEIAVSESISIKGDVAQSRSELDAYARTDECLTKPLYKSTSVRVVSNY
jgi:hypothetical protein